MSTRLRAPPVAPFRPPIEPDIWKLAIHDSHIEIRLIPVKDEMDNATAPPDQEAASRRRSGRVSRAPAKFSPEPIHATKRKRGETAGDDDDDDDEDDDDQEDDDGTDTHEADDDDISDAHGGDDPLPRRSRPRNKPASRAKQPAVKKPKTNGLSLNHAANLPTRPKKADASANLARAEDGDLYCECCDSPALGAIPSRALTLRPANVFDKELDIDTVAEVWRQKYQQDDAAALMDLVNFVLRCCGCDLQVTEDDIRDPDNSEDRLTELQELYKEVSLALSRDCV